MEQDLSLTFITNKIEVQANLQDNSLVRKITV